MQCLKIKLKTPSYADTNLSAFFNHSWYGLVTATLVKNLGDPSIYLNPSLNDTKNDIE